MKTNLVSLFHLVEEQVGGNLSTSLVRRLQQLIVVRMISCNRMLSDFELFNWSQSVQSDQNKVREKQRVGSPDMAIRSLYRLVFVTSQSQTYLGRSEVVWCLWQW